MPNTSKVRQRQQEPPLRGEPFSAEHLWTYAEQLATRQVARRGGADRRLVQRFEDNSHFIATAYRVIIESVRNDETLAPDAEWLVDNYYVVEEQLREIREDLPRSFYLELPKLTEGPFDGFPRVYELAHELIVHTDSSLDEELVSGFITAYQRKATLTSGEVWAVPIMLRLVLVENLRRLCGQMLVTRDSRPQAELLLKQWQAQDKRIRRLDAHQDGSVIVELVELLAKSNLIHHGTSDHELFQQLAVTPEMIDDSIRREQQRLAANQVSIGNAITSMRLISALDWALFFERVSLVEQILRQDPAGVYPLMDFATRDQYRHEVERIAKHAGHDETSIAKVALTHASAALQGQTQDARRHHVGYFLLGEGQTQLEREFNYQRTLAEQVVRWLRRHAAVVYLGGVALVTAAVTLGIVAAASFAGVPVLAGIVLGCLSVLPASEIAVGLINFLVTITIRPRVLPKLDFSEEVPASWLTLVVMPTLLSSEAAVRRLLERLEVHYLANPEPGLRFALLSDFVDSTDEESSEDGRLLAVAAAGIQALNDRHSVDSEQRFFLLHRRRKWNPIEKIWMGWERKRGKLLELNRLLRGGKDTSFIVTSQEHARLASIQLVITLDSDTHLPHAVARRLAGTLAHPLNRPHFDPEAHRVTRGYGVLQPRVSVSLASANRSMFARIYSNSGGLDPYCTAVSDVYQDLFNEGSYTGKGIYDVDAFALATKDTFPPNHILSHDLIEGCFARVGLVSDVELFDEYPTRVDVEARRQHRWIRGDWQILPWLFRRVPTPHGPRKNPLNAISRWKIFDNLRRSLVPISLILLCLVGWLVLSHAATFATLIAAAALASPFFFHVLAVVLTWRPGQYWKQQFRDTLPTVGRTLLQCVLTLVQLPFRAYYTMDAVLRTLYRLCISRRKLLEWETADAAERRLRSQSASLILTMSWIPITCLTVAALLPSEALTAALPILALWFLSPGVAYYLSRPMLAAAEPISAEDRQALRRIARRTWSFFEEFVGAEDNWLPPDNYQEFPRPKIAHRISPTNEGLFIVSAIAARDFGYLGADQLARLLHRNLEHWTMLDRYSGHFYNWYDTTTLEPLPPRYVSTADSGNLAACFLTAQQGIEDILVTPFFGPFLAEGVTDSVQLVEEALGRLQPRGARFVSTALDALEAALSDLRTIVDSAPSETGAWLVVAENLKSKADRLPKLLHDFEESLGLKTSELASKVHCLRETIAGLHRDAELMLPWARCLVSDDSSATHQKLRVPTQIADPAWQAAWNSLDRELRASPTLQHLSKLSDRITPTLSTLNAIIDSGKIRGAEAQAARAWLDELDALVTKGTANAQDCHDRLVTIGRRYEALAKEMDFTLLYNPQRRLFAVGYNLEEGRLDRAHYDMLASEARIASLVAIAKSDTEHRHWFQLGRALTETPSGGVGLLSWGGTMFEFLMPTLFARDVQGSLLERSCEAAVARQIAYGRHRDVPWGISESAFCAQAANGDYHYQSFGVPGLGLKRGLGKDLVVSPYSTALALPIRPAAAVANFRALTSQGAEGPWGFYDALDYTPERVPSGERRVIVFCYMAHHQGMIMAALANFLHNQSMQRRFQRQPLVRSTDLLLQERVPVAVLHFNPPEDAAVSVPAIPVTTGPVSRQISTPHTVVPRAHLLSNGQYSVMVSNSGGGYSRYKDIAITRWRADTTHDDLGQFVYLRDLANNKVWSVGYHPVQTDADAYEVTYSIDKAEFRRRDGNLETHLEITVSPETTAEVRQVTITNHGRKSATVEVTSYAELVLGAARADAAHPAFSKLFVETEFLSDCPALVARRRPRENGAEVPWAVHVLAAQPSSLERLQFETDRARFLGRGRTHASPAALEPDAVLSGTVGPVLDPIFSLRGHLQIAPDESASLAFMTGYAASRDEALQLADQFRDPRLVQRTFEMAWAQSQIELRHLHISPTSLQLYQRLASALLYPDPSLRASPSVLKANRLGQRSLWRHGVSGDDPIILLRASKPDHRSLIRELLYAHEFWNTHGLKADLVIINEHPSGYFDQFQEQLLELISTTTRMPLSKPGGVYLLRTSQMSPEEVLLFQEVAAISLLADSRPLARQVETSTVAPPAERPKLRPARDAAPSPVPDSRLSEHLPPLEFANRLGGFDPNGDYVVELQGDTRTPAPWSNIIANPTFGFLITDSGSGYTWAGNSRENKLTSWSNDPVSDPPSEVVYLRDEETGAVWTPTPLPIRDHSQYRVVHGRGHTRFTHIAHGIHSELTLSIAAEDAVKFACLKLRNETDRLRRLSVTYFAEWVLSVTRDASQVHVYTSQDAATGALTARNSYNEEFPDQIAFLSVVGGADSVTGDRTEFIGRNGNLRMPAAMRRVDLSGQVGAGFDPCGAAQKKLRLLPGQESEVIFLLGWTDGSKSAADVLSAYSTADHVHQAIEQTIQFWAELRQSVEVKTPNRSFDLLVNHWLLYQTLSCRIWARSAFYQSGGAFGFRDQLQDVMALVYSRPQLARQMILLAASRQFEQGDVQHWWHPPSGRGIRTTFSDDYLWLPFVVSHYIATTSDRDILNESISYLRSPPLEPHEDERYELPEISPLVEDLYAHCLRAMDHAFRFGDHGLPLMGCGDWNDGMNRVGIHGKGESVWLAWFLRVLLQQFIPLVESRGDVDRTAAYTAEAERLLIAVEQHAWDGDWYRRAYFDDGTPLGSAKDDECQIDSLTQSWSVIAGGDPQRSRTAMQSAYERLVRPDDHLVQLLDPPFDKTPLDPGYIKGYPPGIRENGGQYTHAATWFVQALTMLGNGTDAVKIFDLLNPIHSASPAGVKNYRVEPYVVAADVYSTPPHVGRGGWTWYTGSAGWMYRVAIECILGVRLRGDRLTLSPCIPADWPGFELQIRRQSTTWNIRVENPEGLERGEATVTIDGKLCPHEEIRLDDDGRRHEVQVVLRRVKSTRILAGNGEPTVVVPEPHSTSLKAFKRVR